MNRKNNGQSQNAYTDREALLRRIQAIGFAKTETALYLDAHSDCSVALEYYKKLTEEYNMLTERYENEYGALRAEGTAPDRWNWVDGLWPWQIVEG